MHFSIDRTAHTTAFDKPVVDHWLERKIAQTAAGSTQKDRSDDRPLQRRARYRLSYIPLLPYVWCHITINKMFWVRFVCLFVSCWVFFIFCVSVCLFYLVLLLLFSVLFLGFLFTCLFSVFVCFFVFFVLFVYLFVCLWVFYWVFVVVVVFFGGVVLEVFGGGYFWAFCLFVCFVEFVLIIFSYGQGRLSDNFPLRLFDPIQPING